MSASGVELVGSTPCGTDVRKMLTIPVDIKCDFIRWDLNLDARDKGRFQLDINYGEGQPNTPGFWYGGLKRSFSGVVSARGRSSFELRADRAEMTTSIEKISENIYHLLDANKRRMIGTGGWSYTLNRKSPVENASIINLPAGPESPKEDVTYVGRTPCRELMSLLHMSDPCYKIKWKLVLKRDPRSGEPVNYILSRTGDRTQTLEGKWSVESGKASAPKAVVYRLDPDKPEKAIDLLAAENDLLFFLDQNGRLLTGNADFSFTLNRKID